MGDSLATHFLAFVPVQFRTNRLAKELGSSFFCGNSSFGCAPASLWAGGTTARMGGREPDCIFGQRSTSVHEPLSFQPCGVCADRLRLARLGLLSEVSGPRRASSRTGWPARPSPITGAPDAAQSSLFVQRLARRFIADVERRGCCQPDDHSFG